MKRRRYAVILCIIMAAAFFMLAGPLKFDIQKRVIIHASLFEISKQYTDLHNWPSWYPALRNLPASAVKLTENSTLVNSAITWNNKHTLLVTALNPAAIVIKETNDGTVIYHSIEGFPADYGNSTIISWTKKANGWTWVLEKLFSSGEISTGLNELKKKCEDPANEYGFDIKIEQVSDTIIVTKKINAGKKEKFIRQHLLHNSIKSFLQAQHIPIEKKYVYASTISIGREDSIAIAVGIPVAKKGSNSNDIKFLELPAKGRFLVGSYTGVYGQINKLYEAMDRYVKNKGMKIVAQPMEKFPDFDSLSNDSSRVSLKVIYPIY